MTSLVQIAQSWYKFISAEEATKQLMEQRLAVCDTCPNKQQLTGVGKLLVGIVENNKDNLFKCGLCGCPLSGLTAHPANKCSDNPPKWDVAGAEPSFY